MVKARKKKREPFCNGQSLVWHTPTGNSTVVVLKDYGGDEIYVMDEWGDKLWIPVSSISVPTSPRYSG